MAFGMVHNNERRDRLMYDRHCSTSMKCMGKLLNLDNGITIDGALL